MPASWRSGVSRPAPPITSESPDNPTRDALFAGPSRAHSPAVSRFGRHLKHALHEEWNKSSNPSRVSKTLPPRSTPRVLTTTTRSCVATPEQPPLRHPTDPASSYATTGRSADSSSVSAISSADGSRRRVPPPPLRTASGYAPPPGRSGDDLVDSNRAVGALNRVIHQSGAEKGNELEKAEAEQMQAAVRASLQEEERKNQVGRTQALCQRSSEACL